MKKNILCAVVFGSTMNELVQMILLAQKKVNLIEVRIDYLIDQKSIDLLHLKKIACKDMIITCRRSDEGGKWNGTKSERLAILTQAVEFEFAFVDVELKTLEEGSFSIPHDGKTKVIVSHHDFDKTPPLDELKIISKRMQLFNPHIKKIATLVKNDSDIHTLYTMLIEKNENETYCVIGMGPLGKQTRILSPLLGGSFTYCSISSDRYSAPGQMTCKEMKDIYRLLE